MSLKVMIDATEITKIISVHLSITAELDNFGERSRLSNPMHVIITRDCKKVAQLDSFKAATQRPNRVSQLTVTLTKLDGRTPYTVTLNDALVSGWKIGADEGGGDLVETLELYSGDVKFSVFGESKTYKLGDFNL